MKNLRTITVGDIIKCIPLLNEDELRKMLEDFSTEAYNQGESDERESNYGYDTYSK